MLSWDNKRSKFKSYDHDDRVWYNKDCSLLLKRNLYADRARRKREKKRKECMHEADGTHKVSS